MSNQYNHKVRVGVVIIHNNSVLLVRQNQKPFWVLPGGTLEVGESLISCGIREIREELNLEIRIQKVLYLADFIQASPALTRHTVDIFLLASLGSNINAATLATDENLDDMGWYTLPEFAQLTVQPVLAARQIATDWPMGFQQANGLYLGTYGVS
jgi:ADP-ribose pyrophosphatase YjhB (NUDIX family)